ncbi:MAG: UDP-glucose 4-epimerase GalE [Nocardioidaceae bacterium]|nr:UDP-glucose 4-epimerase GalE [Nocardioidaceae bacterium]
MTILVTGGAGYIGAHVVRLLRARGDAVVVDDLSTGSAERIADAPLVEIDLAAEEATAQLTAVMHEYGVEAVIHIAAKKQVGESAERPAWYYDQNVGAMAHLLMAMESAGVDKLMFSSSAATYGLPDLPADTLLPETVECKPISPYGKTKLICEWMCQDAEAAWGLRWAGLRYFNVAGSGWPELGDPAVLNLIPIALRALTNGEQPTVFGDDYDTPDGTCIRDYVHVLDLAQAHLDTLNYLSRGDRPHEVFNVGTGVGASVSEVLEQIGVSTGYVVDPPVVARRAGDPAKLVADVQRIQQTLGWSPTQTLAEMVDSAWAGWAPIHGEPAVAPS